MFGSADEGSPASFNIRLSGDLWRRICPASGERGRQVRYVSTRGDAEPLGFEDVLLSGLAPDGGLYLPESWPRFDPATLAGLASRPYHEVAARLMAPFTEPAIDEATLGEIAQASYADFDHPVVAPLVQLDANDWLLELFHGPTLAFKDYALQIVGRLFDHVLASRGQRVTVVAATSGDTGSAAIEACRDRAGIEIFVLHPKGRVSEVQRRQMTTVDSPNVHNIAVEGTFDDCQDLVKAMFNDARFRADCRLTAVNSINWARIAAQAVYYVTAAVALGSPHRPVAFAVPTGNFGNVFAGYAARSMGLPVEQFVIATNRNDILARFLETGSMEIGEVVPTISPSMDIQVSSNFERLLYDFVRRDGAAVRRALERFRQSGRMTLAAVTMAGIRELFAAGRRTDDETRQTIADVFARSDIVLDPHSAVGYGVGRARRRNPEIPLIALATAHPAKFPDAVEAATGMRPDLPPRLAALMARPERVETMANDVAAIKAHVRERIGPRGAA